MFMTGIFVLFAFLIKAPEIRRMVSILVVLAGIQSMAAFWALLWALPKSNTSFFSVFVGDALLRLGALAASTYWLSSQKMAYTVPLLALALAYLAFSIVSIPFYSRVR